MEDFEDDELLDEGLLPFGFVVEQMERDLPKFAIISDAAAEAVQLCVSEMVHFVTCDVVEYCGFDNKKTIHGEDLITSMGSLGFEEYVMPLHVNLKMLRKFLSAAPEVVGNFEELMGCGETGKDEDGDFTKMGMEEDEKIEENGDDDSVKGIVKEEEMDCGEAEETSERLMQGVDDGIHDEPCGVLEK